MLARLRQIPAAHTEGITHVWLRRMGPKDDRPLGTYSYGLDHAVIILYPWPRSLRWWFPRGRRPWFRWHLWTRCFEGRLGKRNGRWYAQFTFAGARRFFLDQLLLHEVGHHVDGCERFSPANHKSVEGFADQYAAQWARKLPLLSEEQR